MPKKKTKEQIKQNMSRVRNRDTQLENALCDALKQQGIRTFTRNDKTVYGKPDVVFKARRIAIFCDGDFWHGYDWENRKNSIKSHRDYWIPKIERNIEKDVEVNHVLHGMGYTVIRLWEHEIRKDADDAADMIMRIVNEKKNQSQCR